MKRMSSVQEKSDRPKRRWLQFSVRGLLVLVAVIAVVLAWPNLKRYWAITRLAEFENRDIRAMDEAEQAEVKSLIRELTHEEQSVWDLDYYESRYVWRLPNRKPWLAIFSAQSVTNASESGRVIFFDRLGNEIARRELPLESKLIWFETGAVEEHGQEFPLLAFDTSRPLAGVDVRRRYYALEDCDLELVRMEDGQGLPVVCHWRPEGIVKWVRSESTLPIGVAGPEIENAADRPDWRTVFVEQREPTLAEWREELHTTDTKRILRAFLFAPRWKTVEDPMDRPTRKRIDELAENENPWIAEAAQVYRDRMVKEAARWSGRKVAR
jgi:hypothetical protein